MKTVSEKKECIIEIKKSKFISYAIPVNSEEDVDTELNNIRLQHNSATHVTYAYVLYSPSLEKCSDDGEPGGTAGKPILENIKRRNLQNILVVVVRYFGGIKLGAGGLVRAYSNSAKEVLEISDVKELNYHKIFEVEITIDNKYLIENSANMKVLDIDYSRIGEKKVIYKLAINLDEDVTMVKNIASGFRLIEERLM